MKSKHLLLMLLCAFFAPWAANGQNRTQLNEGFDNSFPPAKWSTIHVSGTKYWEQKTDYKHDGTASAAVQYATNSHENWLVTPQLAPAANEALTFYVSSQTYSGTTLYVMLSTTTSTTDAFTVTLASYTSGSGGTIGSTSLSSFVEKTIPASALESYVGQPIYIAFRVVDNDGSWIYLDDVSGLSIYVAPYPKPTDFQMTASDHESVSFSWTAPEQGPNTLTGYAYQYKKASDTDWPTSWTSGVDASATTLTIHELDASTSYNFRLKALYGSNESEIVTTDGATTAQATAVGDSWSDDFEGTECGWELINGTLTNANWAWGEAVNNGGTHAIYISNDGGTTNAYTNSGYAVVFATKLLNFADGKYAFSYHWKCDGETQFDNLRVGLVPASVELVAINTSTNTLPTGWVALYDGSYLSEQTTWQSVVEKTATVTAGNYYLVLRWRQDSNGGENPPAAVDNVSITRVACPYDVTGLAVATEPAVTQTTATVTWTAGEATQWQVAYSTNSNFEGATQEIVSTASYNMTGLTANTKYYVKVRAYCGGEDYGTWCNAISFYTACPEYATIPFNEKFDDMTGVTSSNTNNLPQCWNYINTISNTSYQGLPVVYNSSSQAYSGNNYLRFYSYNSLTGDEYAILPAMENVSSLRVKLYASAYTSNGTTYDATFQVGVMTSLTDASTFVAVGDPINATSSYTQYTIPLNSYTGEGNYIAIKMESPTTSSRYVFIDDILVEEIPSCVEPTGLDVTASVRTATLTWAKGEGTAWQVAHATSATANPDDCIVSTTNTVSGETVSCEFNDLALDADHYFWVRTNCDGEYSQWTDPVSVHIGWCVPAPTSVDNNGITNITFGVGNNIVNNNTHPTSAPFYGNYVSQIGAMQAGVESTVAITYGHTYTYGTLIWVDFNNNLSFEDSEIVYMGTSAGSINPHTLSATFTIPATQATGDYRMRIGGADSYFDSYISDPTGTGDHDPCSDGTWKIFEDYTLRVLPEPSCYPVKNLTKSNLKAHSVDLGWTLLDSEQTSFDVQYSTDANFTEGDATHLNEGVSLTEGVYNLSGLTANTHYYVRVRGNCGSGDGVSEWCTPINFTTAIGNPAPSGLAVETNGYGAHSITLKWTNGGGDYETSWEIAYSTDADFNPDEATPVAANTNPFTLTGLNHNTTYYGYVRSNCGTDGMSAWSAKQPFSTLNATNTPTFNAATDITNEGATISWTAPANNDHHESYELYYSTENTMPATLEAPNYITNIMETSKELTGLNDLKKYYVWVRDNCGNDGNSPWSTTPINFTTLQTPVVVDADNDFTDDFEGDLGWVLLNGDRTNAWVHGTATNNGGEKALYVSNNDGTTNAYTTNSAAVVYATKVFTLAEGTYAYSYDWKANGEISSGTPYDYLRVALVPAGTALNASTSLPSGLSYNSLPTGWKALDGGSQLFQQSDWSSINNEVAISETEAGNYMVVFVWRNDGSSGSNPPAAIDNFSLSVSLCNIPVDLEATATGTTANISWTSTNNNFTLRYKKASESSWIEENIHVTGTFYPISGLQSKTQYQVEVVSNCPEGDSDPATLTFTTAYGVPFVENFATNSIPANWARYTGSVANAFNGTNPSTATGGWVFNNTNVFGKYHARINIYNNNNYKWLTTPNIDLTTATDASKLNLIFDLAITDYNSTNAPGSGEPANDDQFRVLVSTDGGATWTENNSWVWMNEGGDYVYSDVPNTGQTVMLPLANYANGSVMIAFYAESGSTTTSADFDIHIDNVYVGEPFTKTIEPYTSHGYYLIASPLNGQVNPENVTNMLENEYALYRFNEGATEDETTGITLEWENYKAHTNDFMLESGRGYLYANSEEVELTFTGVPYNGDGVVTLNWTEGAEFAGWNLVGNPFGETAYILDNNYSFYTMKEGGAELEANTSFTSIEPMEGVFVYTEEDGATLTFSTDAPEGNGDALTLNVSKGRSVIDRAIVNFGQGGKLPKFMLNRNSTKVYIPQDGKEYAVVNAESQGEMPVSFKAEENGTYTLSFNSTEVMFNYLHLIDNMTGNDVDLLQTPSYTFNATTTDYSSRFKLVFAVGSSTDSETFAFYSNGNWIINNEGEALLQVIDVNGHILSSETVNGSVSKAINTAPGVYMIRLINGDNVRTQKVVVR